MPQLLRRGLESAIPVLGIGEEYIATNANRRYVGLPNGGMMLESGVRINDIGKPDNPGAGVGICPPAKLPSYMMPMLGTFDPNHENYGNYIHVIYGSVMVYNPRCYVKHESGNVCDIKSIYDYASEAAANAAGYFLPRCFIDGGAVIEGFFFDKYDPSLTHVTWSGVTQLTGVFNSIKNGNPISTAVDTKRDSTNNYAGSLSNCISNGQTPADIYGGIFAAVKSRGNDFAPITVFEISHLDDIRLWLATKSTSSLYCAWYDAAGIKNYPKGNNNFGADIDDATVTYSACDDGYWAIRNEARKTGSANILEKTTHNGQKNGIADLNGNLYKIAIGLTNIDGTSTGYRILKESVVLKNLTGGSGGATDHFSNASLFDNVTLPSILTSIIGWIKLGNGINQVLAPAALNRSTNAYLLNALGMGKDDNAYSDAGTNLFGTDGTYRYNVNELCLLVSADWADTTIAGLRARVLGSVRTGSGRTVSGRARLSVLM